MLWSYVCLCVPHELTWQLGSEYCLMSFINAVKYVIILNAVQSGSEVI